MPTRASYTPRNFASPSALYNFRANPEAHACVQVRKDCKVCHAASRTLRHAGMSACVDMPARSAGVVHAAAPLSARRRSPPHGLPPTTVGGFQAGVRVGTEPA